MILFAPEPKSEPGPAGTAAVMEAPASAPANAVEPPDPTPVRSKQLSAPAPRRTACDRANIKVIGVGGGGGNAVNRMIESGITGVEFIAANTDAQVLEQSRATVTIQLGSERTAGLGCGGDPEIGRLAAQDDMDRLIEALRGADMVFLTVGEGGGTGTGAAPVVACVAREVKALCVAVVTRPLSVEGRRRRETADDGIRELREFVDTLICVPNDRVVAVYGDKPIREAFRDADDVVRQAVQGISDLIQTAGEINLDFADVRSAMRAQGDAVMGVGSATGNDRVEEATLAAISSPLLEDTSIRGATSIIVNITGGESLTMNEVQRAAEVVREAVAPKDSAPTGAVQGPGDNILLGTALDPSLDDPETGGEIRVTVVATGFPHRARTGVTPQDFQAYVNRGTGTLGRPGAAPAARAASPESAELPPLDPPTIFRSPKFARKPGDEVLPLDFPESAPASGESGTDSTPAPAPADTGEDRWGDLETPPYLNRHGASPR